MKKINRLLPLFFLAVFIVSISLSMTIPAFAAYDEDDPLLGTYKNPGTFGSSNSSYLKLYTIDGLQSVDVPLVDSSLLPSDREPVAVCYFLADYFVSPDPMYIYYPVALYFYGSSPTIVSGFDDVPAPYFRIEYDEVYKFRLTGTRTYLDDGTPVVQYSHWEPASVSSDYVFASVPAVMGGYCAIDPSFDYSRFVYLFDHIRSLDDEVYTVFSFSDFLSSIGQIFTSAVSWVGNVGSTILQQPLLLAFTALPLCGLGIAVFRRLKETV